MKKKDMNKKNKIQDAVAEIILAEGPAAVSTTKVAKKVGIAQSNVYLYFQNKQELIDSLYRREINRIINSADIELLTDQEIDISKRIKIYIQQVFDYSLANPKSLTLIQEVKSLNGQGMEIGLGQQENFVKKLLNEAVENSIIKPLPISLHMSLVFSVIHTHTNNVAQGVYPADQYEFADIYQFIWDGMRLIK